MKVRASWSIAIGGVLLLLVAGSVAVRSIVREPSYLVRAMAQNGLVVIEWSSCNGGKPVEAHFLSVIPEGNSEGLDVCRLLPTAAAVEGLPLQSGWRYGTIPVGYVVEGRCPPLVPGRDYRVRVGGRIGGDTVFHITPNGTIDIVSQSCDSRGWW